MTVFIGCLGVLLLLLVLQDSFEVMLLPRRVVRRQRLTRLFFRTTWRAWRGVVRLVPEGVRREHLLAIYGAASMVLLFWVWAAGLITGFGLLDWSLEPAGAALNLRAHLYLSGVTFFTLGYGDLVPRTAATRALAVLEAGLGFGFIAVVIGYLPVLYQLFSRREAHVIRLDGRAGSPPTATTMLQRHAECGDLQRVDALMRDWELWGAELLESHLSYPMLVFYRSQHADQSWLAALIAVMDACALVLVGYGELCPLQARMTFTMARHVLVEIVGSFRFETPLRTQAERLPGPEYRRMAEILRRTTVGWSEEDTTEATLATLRATYEPYGEAIAQELMLRLPAWVSEIDAADHWQLGPRGFVVTRLLSELAHRANEPRR